jgi:hypothetical protein
VSGNLECAQIWLIECFEGVVVGDCEMMVKACCFGNDARDSYCLNLEID